jgi:FtsP/CotA-like multicopper oxidase with cupredoxin domain
MDGVMGQGGMIFPGTNFTYDFIAGPVGVYPYHCHMAPVQEHVSRGLYGMLIIDPVKPRPHAIEMVMTMNAFSFSYEGLNGSGHLTQTTIPTMQQLRNNLSAAEDATDEANGPDNQVYAVNTMAFGYEGKHMIHLFTNTPYRIYLLNTVEFDPVNSFHIHGTLFNYTESGTEGTPKIATDLVTLGQMDRGILEFSYPYPGEFMFHSHLVHFSDLGWVGFFLVTKPGQQPFQ